MTAVLREEPAGTTLEEAAIPLGYQDIVKHCLEKDPENRFQSAKDLVFRAADSFRLFVAAEIASPDRSRNARIEYCRGRWLPCWRRRLMLLAATQLLRTPARRRPTVA